MKRRKALDIAVIGGGKVGNTIGRLFLEGGDHIVAVVSRTSASARRSGRFLRCRHASTELSALPPRVDLVFIATPHAAVPRVAEELARLPGRSWKGVAVCHASGMLTAAVLAPLRRRGALVFSFHPLQTFPREVTPGRMVPAARGIFFGADGTPPAMRFAARTAARLGGRLLRVPPARRALYHAACVVASNQLTGLLSVLEGIAGASGIRNEDFYRVFKPIITATLRNIEFGSPAAALSGPVARGGLDTVRDHCAAVRRWNRALLPSFTAMTRETIRLARTKGSVTESRARAMTRLVRSYERIHRVRRNSSSPQRRRDAEN